MKRKRYPKIRRIYNGEVLDLMDTKKFWELVKHGYGEDFADKLVAVSYTHLRAHETPEHLVCRLLLEKKKNDYEPPE